jgi:hypothetical protein
MEPEGSLPPSEEPATGAYPEPDEARPHSHPTPLRSPFHPHLGLPSEPFPLGFTTKITYLSFIFRIIILYLDLFLVSLLIISIATIVTTG